MGSITELLERAKQLHTATDVKILKIRTEKSFGTQIECAPQTYSLFRKPGGEYFFRHWRLYEDGKRRSQKIDLDRAAVEALLKRLDEIEIPAFPEHEIGEDGGYTEIEVGGFRGRSAFRWWSCPPAGWESLDTVVDELLGLVEDGESTCD